MKQTLHPTVHPVVYVDTSSGEEFVTTSILTSNETKDINGVSHYVLRIEISSSSHPFYTGKDRFVDSTGRVDKFKEKMEKAAAAAGTRGIKKAKKAAAIAAEQEAATAAKKVKKAAAPVQEASVEEPASADMPETASEDVTEA